jgi:hypothetical protein
LLGEWPGARAVAKTTAAREAAAFVSKVKPLSSRKGLQQHLPAISWAELSKPANEVVGLAFFVPLFERAWRTLGVSGQKPPAFQAEAEPVRPPMNTNQDQSAVERFEILSQTVVLVEWGGGCQTGFGPDKFTFGFFRVRGILKPESD